MSTIKEACVSVDFDKLDYRSKFTLDRLAGKFAYARTKGYPKAPNLDDDIDLLCRYKSIVEDEQRKLKLGGKACLDSTNLQLLSERVNSLSQSCDITCRRDVIVDKSGLDAWVAQNPFCVSREKWERWSYQVWETFKMDISLVDSDVVCDLSFQLVRDVLPCDVLVALAVQKQMCDVKAQITRTYDQCLLDYNILASKANCDIDLKTFNRLIAQNFSYDIVQSVLDSGCTFEIGDGLSEETINLVTTMGSFPIETLNFGGYPDVEVLNKMGIDVSSSEYAKNPKQFIQKLKQDYSG